MPDTMIQAFPAPTVSLTIPVEIAKAIGEVMTQIKSLPKGERNDHGGYNFASIDDFLAAIGPLCSAAGLIVLQDEHSIDMIDRGGKAWVKATYSFRLGHTSGVICERPMLRTVFQAITGPQTMGSSQSYSLKQFLRSLFMIPTGDRDDSDYHKQQDMPAAQVPQKSPQRVEQSRRTDPAPTPPKATQQASSGSDEPQHMPLPMGKDGPLVNRWTKAALEALEGKSIEWRYAWLAMHPAEMAEIHDERKENWERINAVVTGDAVQEAAE